MSDYSIALLQYPVIISHIFYGDFQLELIVAFSENEFKLKISIKFLPGA